MIEFFSKIKKQKWFQFAAITCAILLLIPGGFPVGHNGDSFSSYQAFAQELVMGMNDDYCEMMTNATWYLESNTHQMTVIIQPSIVITNVTDGTIEGKIVDSRTGYLLGMYGSESVILANFGYDEDSSRWYIAGKPVHGKFVVRIPDEHLGADYVQLWVNSNSFSVSPSEDALLPRETTIITTTTAQTATEITAIKIANATSITTSQNGNATITVTVTNTTATTTIKVVNAADVATSQIGTTATVTVTNATDVITTVAKTTTTVKNQYMVGQMLTVTVKEDKTFEIKGSLLSVMMYGKSNVLPEPKVYQSQIRVRTDSAFEEWLLRS